MPKRKYDYGMMVGTNGKHKYKNREDYFASCSIRAIFKRDEKLQNEDVMTQELGHINSSADGHYHTFNVCCKTNIEKISGVTLHRASSLGLCEHGLALVQDDEENETS